MSGIEFSNVGDTFMEENSDLSSSSKHVIGERMDHNTNGELCCLASGADIDTIQAWLKSADAVTIKTELFSRDNLQQTPLSLALKRGDAQIVSLLLSLGEQICRARILFFAEITFIPKQEAQNRFLFTVHNTRVFSALCPVLVACPLPPTLQKWVRSSPSFFRPLPQSGLLPISSTFWTNAWSVISTISRCLQHKHRHYLTESQAL